MHTWIIFILTASRLALSKPILSNKHAHHNKCMHANCLPSLSQFLEEHNNYVSSGCSTVRIIITIIIWYAVPTLLCVPQSEWTLKPAGVHSLSAVPSYIVGMIAFRKWCNAKGCANTDWHPKKTIHFSRFRNEYSDGKLGRKWVRQLPGHTDEPRINLIFSNVSDFEILTVTMSLDESHAD